MPFYKPHTEKKITNPNKSKAAQLASLKKPYKGIKKLFKRSHDARPKSSEGYFFGVSSGVILSYIAIVTAYKPQTAP